MARSPASDPFKRRLSSTSVSNYPATPAPKPKISLRRGAVFVAITMGLVAILGAVYLMPQMIDADRKAAEIDGQVAKNKEPTDPERAAQVRTKGNPGARSQGITGWRFGPDHVATADQTAVPRWDIARSAAVWPARLQTDQAPSSDCTARPVKVGEVFHSVMLERGVQAVDLGLVQHRTRVAHARDWLSDLPPTSADAFDTYLPISETKVIDVYVTDLSGPLYLALQSREIGLIWRVHLAPGVRLAHIAVFGRKQGVLTSTDVDISLVSPHPLPKTNPLRRQKSQEKRCFSTPYRMPLPDWQQTQKAERGVQLYVNQRKTYQERAFLYHSWFEQAVGISPTEVLTGIMEASAVLVGPKPEAALDFPMFQDGARLTVSRGIDVLQGNIEARHRANRDAQLRLLSQASGRPVDQLLYPVLPGQLTKGMVLSFREDLLLEDLLGDTPLPEDQETKLLWAQARVSELSKPLCDVLNAAGAKACAFLNADVANSRSRSAPENQLRVTARLKIDLGIAGPDVASRSRTRASVNLLGKFPQPVSLVSSPESLALILEMAQTVCRNLAQVYMQCRPDALNITTARGRVENGAFTLPDHFGQAAFKISVPGASSGRDQVAQVLIAAVERFRRDNAARFEQLAFR